MIETINGLFLVEEKWYYSLEALKYGIYWYLVFVCPNFIFTPVVDYLLYFLVAQ